MSRMSCKGFSVRWSRFCGLPYLNTRQTRHRAVDGHIAVGAPDDVFRLLAEPAFLRAAVALVPDSGAAPDPACPLEGICCRRKLPPVNEHAHRRTGLADLSRLVQPLRCPAGPGTLILGVAVKGWGRVLSHAGIFLDGGLAFFRLCPTAGGIRGICDDRVEGAGGKAAQHLQRVTVDELPFLVSAQACDSPSFCYLRGCRGITLSPRIR